MSATYDTYVRIEVTQANYYAMQGYVENRGTYGEIYNIFTNNCLSYVVDGLSVGGVSMSGRAAGASTTVPNFFYQDAEYIEGAVSVETGHFENWRLANDISSQPK